MGHSQCGPSRGRSGPECSGQSQPDMHWGHTWAGPAAPAALGELDVGSLAERATRPGPSRARTPWLGPAGDTRLAAGAGGWLGRGTATPSGAGRLGLSAATARQGTGRQGWPRPTAASPRQGVLPHAPRSRACGAATQQVDRCPMVLKAGGPVTPTRLSRRGARASHARHGRAQGSPQEARRAGQRGHRCSVSRGRWARGGGAGCRAPRGPACTVRPGKLPPTPPVPGGCAPTPTGAGVPGEPAWGHVLGHSGPSPLGWGGSAPSRGLAPPKSIGKRQRGPRAPCAHTISQDSQSPSFAKHRDREGTHRARTRPPRREAAEPTGTQKGSPANRTPGDPGPRVAGAPLGERPRARLTPHPAAVLPRTSPKNPKPNRALQE